MEFLFGLLLLGLFVGLLIRKKGDSFTDTLESGCGCLSLVIFILIVIVILLSLI